MRMEIIAARKEKDGCGRRTTSRKSREDGEKRVIRTKGIRRAINHLATYSLQGRSPLRDTNIITTASFFFFIPSSLLGFFLSREREKDVHVLEHQSVRHSCGTTRGRIQREAGKKTESILLSDAGIISFHFERVNEHLYPRVRGFTPRENGKESSILIYDHDFSPPPLSSSRTSSPHN